MAILLNQPFPTEMLDTLLKSPRRSVCVTTRRKA
jgi:hypothetical protein